MSTHNIGFYEEISKIITKLSSKIIKYAPYFICCMIMYVYMYKSLLGINKTFGFESIEYLDQDVWSDESLLCVLHV